jgi:hypothetical protein
VHLTNLTTVGYTFAIESNSVDTDVRAVINNEDLPDKKKISMTKTDSGVQIVILNKQKQFFSPGGTYFIEL